MGSITRTSRCDRFRKKLEKQIVAKSPMQVGDWLEVVGVGVGLSEDGAEVSKLYVTVRNKRTEDETAVTFDECLYAPEDVDENNAARLHDYLFYNQGYEESPKFAKNWKRAVRLLKGAALISSKFPEEP